MPTCTCVRKHVFGRGYEEPPFYDPGCPVHGASKVRDPMDAFDAEAKAVEGRAKDPTAQTLPLTKGQQIVADYEMDMIAEPCELAEAIDKAIVRVRMQRDQLSYEILQFSRAANLTERQRARLRQIAKRYDAEDN